MGNVVTCCKICPKISLDRTRQDDTISLLSNEPSASWSPVLSFHSAPEPVSKMGQTVPPLESCCAASSESGGSGARMPDVVQSVGTPTSILGRNLNPFACCNPLLQGIGQHEADIACAASAAITGTGPSNWTCMVPPSGCQAQWPWVPGDRRETACGIELNPFSLNAMLAVQDWRRTFSGEASGDVGAAGLHTMPPVAGAGEARASVPPLIYDNRLMQLVGEHGFCSGCIEAALCSHCSGSRADGLNLSRAGVPLGLSSNLGMTSGSTEAPCLLAARGTIPASDSVLHGIEPEAQQGYRASLPPGFRSMISDPDAWSDGDRPVDIGQCCGEMGCSCENIVKRVCDVKTRQGFEQTSRSVTGERATSLSDIFSVPQATGKGKRRKKKRRGSSSRKDPGCPTEELPALDAAFPVKISAPGGDNFELQVSWQDLVQDVQQVLMEREETNTRTCFLLHLDGIPLDPFAELRAVEGLSANATLRIVEEPYTMREVRIHLSHVRNLLRGVDQADIYSANDGASPSVVAIVVGESNLTDVPSEGTRRKRKSGNGPETVPDCAPPDYVLPGCKDRPLMPLQPLSRDIKQPVHCLKSMRTSTWNPPPGNRRMHGDLLYLDVVTAEDRRASITASTRGFFINQSTGDEFNPRPASPSLLSHSLIDLLNQLSPIFKKSFTALQKRRLQHSPLEQLPTPFPVYCWAVAPMEHLADCMCTDDARSARLGCDDNPVTQTRDWNEEIQATRELQRQNLPERLLRDRTIFKVHSDFVMTAIRGAEAVVDGNVMAINPGEDSRSQMFVWNNLFFSLGFDVRDHYKALGGDAAAHAAPALDLAGVRAFASLDVEAICCLGTTIVDYRGYRVTAQSVVPGILEREQRQAVTYGSLDFGETVQGSRKIVSLLERSSKPLHVLRHKVLNEKDEEVELVSSVECKGIVGNDGRHYILDLLRTFPPDANFLPPLPGEDPLPDDAFPEPCKHFGFPRPYRHRLVSLRPELVEAFTRAKYEDFMKLAIAKHKSQSEGNADGSEEKEIDNREVIRNACNAVGSVSDCFFDIRFNPDVFTPTVRFPESECESVERQKLLHREASAFLLSHQIPAFLKESLDHSAVILDGATLVEFMHRFGINARYLGTVVRALEEQEERDCNRLHFLHRMLVTEVIVRAAKHLFRTYLQPVEMSTLSVAVAHFLNCFLSSCPSPGTHLATLDEGSASRNRRRSKRRGGGRGAPGAESTSWAQLTPGDLWKNLAVEAQERYSFLITSEGIDQAVEKFGLQKITLLRELCIKGGIQLLLREYVLDGRQKPAFGEEDIENLFPVAKHLWPPACDAQHLLQSAQARIQQGFLKDACDQTAEALNLYNNIFGALHPDICACLRVFARLNFILGNQAEAMIHQEKALIMSERVLGLDNPYTIQDYVICALFAFTNAQVAKALKLLYRARYLALIVCSEDHPQIATIDSNIGLMLTAVEEHDTAQRFLDKALTLNTKHCGEMSLKVALSHHFLARSYAAKGDFRSALKHEKETYTVYNEQFGKMHEKTEASYTYLQQLTDQAVVLQRNVNEICKNGSKPSIQPMQIPAPNMPYILEMLNAINGIVLPTLSCEDLQKLKAEVKELEDMINQEPPPLDVEALIAETANKEESPAGQES